MPEQLHTRTRCTHHRADNRMPKPSTRYCTKIWHNLASVGRGHPLQPSPRATAEALEEATKYTLYKKQQRAPSQPHTPKFTFEITFEITFENTFENVIKFNIKINYKIA